MAHKPLIILPDFSHEDAAGGCVAGVDEAGRGPWAGPVVAAAVILPNGALPAGIHDSKKLSPAKRTALYSLIMEMADVGVGDASVAEIDTLNILQATKLAMQRAVAGLSRVPDCALIDGNQPPILPCRAIALVGGDAKSLSIAAASIIAKVTRDHYMEALAVTYPHYGWERNSGYGTPAHQAGLKAHGVCVHHRRSFKPIKALLELEYDSA